MSVGILGLIFWGPLKKTVDFKRFLTDADMKQAVTPCLLTLDSDFFYATVQVLVPQ